MKKLVIILSLLLVGVGCSSDRTLEAIARGHNGNDGSDGRDGRDGTSCTVSQQEGGALLTCSDDTYIFITNGSNGQNGSNGSDGSDGQAGTDGAAGTSCSVEQTESGALFTCANTSAVVTNGSNGADGQDGSDGQDGAAGQDGQVGQDGASSVTIANYSSSSCVLISGSSKYTKPTGNGNRGIYTSSTCASSTKVAEVAQGEAYWVASNVLASFSESAALRVLTFN